MIMKHNNPLQKEIETYNTQLPDLLAHESKFVLIKGEEVVGFYDTYGDAMNAGYQAFKLEPFLVRRIVSVEPTLFFTRNVRPCHS
jgi:hypothetical protein